MPVTPAPTRSAAVAPPATINEAPPGEYSQVPVFQLPAFHGGLINRRAADTQVVAFLAGDEMDQPRREYGLLQRLGAAWQPPPLALSINPIWSATREADPAFTGRVCGPR